MQPHDEGQLVPMMLAAWRREMIAMPVFGTGYLRLETLLHVTLASLTVSQGSLVSNRSSSPQPPYVLCWQAVVKRW